MKTYAVACLTLLAASLSSTLVMAADSEKPLSGTDLSAPFQSEDRAYFREHRLRAYERTRAGTRQGATCVTPKGVCWIAEPLSSGNDCSCESRRLGTIRGTVGG